MLFEDELKTLLTRWLPANIWLAFIAFGFTLIAYHSSYGVFHPHTLDNHINIEQSLIPFATKTDIDEAKTVLMTAFHEEMKNYSEKRDTVDCAILVNLQSQLRTFVEDLKEQHFNIRESVGQPDHQSHSRYNRRLADEEYRLRNLEDYVLKQCPVLPL